MPDGFSLIAASCERVEISVPNSALTTRKLSTGSVVVAAFGSA